MRFRTRFWIITLSISMFCMMGCALTQNNTVSVFQRVYWYLVHKYIPLEALPRAEIVKSNWAEEVGVEPSILEENLGMELVREKIRITNDTGKNLRFSGLFTYKKVDGEWVIRPISGCLTCRGGGTLKDGESKEYPLIRWTIYEAAGWEVLVSATFSDGQGRSGTVIAYESGEQPSHI